MRHSRQGVRPVTFRVIIICIVVLSSAVAPLGYSPIGQASAASPELCETFEDQPADSGMPDGWENWSSYTYDTLEVDEVNGGGGSQAFHSVESDGSNSVRVLPSGQPFTSNTTSDIQTTYRVENLTGDGEESLNKLILDEGSERVLVVEVKEDGLYYTNSSFTSKLVTNKVGAGQWVNVTVRDINTSSDTFTLSWEAGNESGTATGLETYGNMTNGYDKAKFTINGEGYIHDVGISCDTVSGTVTDVDGNAISNATVETDLGDSAKTDSTGFYQLDLPSGNYTLTASKPGYNASSKDVSVSGDTTVDFTLEGVDTGIEIDARPFMHHGTQQQYVIVIQNGTGRYNLTSEANVTSTDPTVVEVIQSNRTLIATDNVSVNERVTIRANVTDSRGNVYNGTQNVTVANQSVENIEILPTWNRLGASLGSGGGGAYEATGTDLTLRVIIVATMLGAAAAIVAGAFAGIAGMNIIMAAGWIAGWVGDGIIIVTVMMGMFIGLNVAGNIDYTVRR